MSTWNEGRDLCIIFAVPSNSTDRNFEKKNPTKQKVQIKIYDIYILSYKIVLLKEILSIKMTIK